MAKNNAIDIDIETGGGNTYTFPSATSTLASLDLAETLTNKDLSAASNTLGSANVEAAGALMDSELTSIADVKALDQSVVSGAAPVFDGTNFTNIPAGTVDVVSNVATARIIGRTTAGSGDSEQLTASATRTFLNVEDDADKTDTANVEAAGALMDSEVTNLAQVKAFDSTDYAAALGADDNYVTDAEKTVIGNTSGTNTGDQDLSALAPKANPTFTGEIGIGSVNVSETELGILEGATLTTAELNKMDGVTATTAEINYVDGVTSNIQTQLDTKAEDAADVGLGNVNNTSNATERAATATLENKRIQPRVSSSASGNITPTKVDFDRYIRTAQAAAITISNPTMDIGEVMAVQLTDNATARAITFGTHYMALDGLALPTTTTASKVMSMVLEKVTATKVLVSYVNEA